MDPNSAHQMGPTKQATQQNEANDKLCANLTKLSLLLGLLLLVTLVEYPDNVKSKQVDQKLSCLDEDGEQVDWFIAYKFPELADNPHPLNTGYAYSYFTSRTFRGRSYDSKSPNDNRWLVSKWLITDPESVIIRTLSLAFESDKINSLSYNDAPPPGANKPKPRSSSSKAHAKGILMMDDDSGDSVWITHSTPQFPPTRDRHLEFLNNSHVNGQTFMCINFKLNDSGPQVIDHLVLMNPLVYDHRISPRLLELLPELRKLLRRRQPAKNPYATTELSQNIATTEGQILQLYSKNAAFNSDLYSAWMDEELNSTLFVQTWRRGAGGDLSSFCPRNDFHINNIEQLKLEHENNRISWSYLQDHSKWAISETKQSGLVCISDINRMRSQFKRGGGAVCIKCSGCWSTFSNSIEDIESCPVLRSNPKLEVYNF